MEKFLNEFTIIPSVRKLRYLDDALKTEAPVVLLSDVHIGNLESIVKRCNKLGKKTIVNTELLAGFSPDKMGIQLLKDLYKVDCVTSSSVKVINMSKAIGLYTIQRFFLVDSKAFDHGLTTLKSSNADAIELIPSLMASKFYKKIREVKDIPILAGGFITEETKLNKYKDLGFLGITTSDRDLWR